MGIPRCTYDVDEGNVMIHFNYYFHTDSNNNILRIYVAWSIVIIQVGVWDQPNNVSGPSIHQDWPDPDNHLQVRLYHLFLSSLSFFRRSNISSGLSILLVLSKSTVFIRLFNFSIIWSRSASSRACRSDLLTNPFDLSRSIFLPSTPLFNMTDAPTLNRRRGKPALTKRWKFDAEGGGRDSRDAAPAFLGVGWTNLYCSWNDLRDDVDADEGGGVTGCAGCILSVIVTVLLMLVHLHSSSSVISHRQMKKWRWLDGRRKEGRGGKEVAGRELQGRSKRSKQIINKKIRKILNNDHSIRVFLAGASSASERKPKNSLRQSQSNESSLRQTKSKWETRYRRRPTVSQSPHLHCQSVGC